MKLKCTTYGGEPGLSTGEVYEGQIEHVDGDAMFFCYNDQQIWCWYNLAYFQPLL